MSCADLKTPCVREASYCIARLGRTPRLPEVERGAIVRVSVDEELRRSPAERHKS
jgi:hypothetical protein